MSGDNRVYIFDTTLRDGQQSPGAGMSLADNLQYAHYAHLLNIDVLEAGFPAASETDFEIVRLIAQAMADKQSPMIIAGLCQLREEQLVRTMQALSPALPAGKARVHTYVPVDPNLMQASLGKLAQDKQQIVDEVHRLIAQARQEGFEVEFSPEGYSRMQDNFDFVTDLIRAAVSAGAKVINCPDTIGGASRVEGDAYFVNKMRRHAEIIAQEFPQQSVIWSMHCHNDFGLALENSITGVFEGPARQIEGCINGVGERAGNAALEQCIMYLRQFGALANPEQPYYTNIDVSHLKTTSDFIAKKMLPRQPHTPITGDNAACHSSGGHTNAILKNPQAYQPFDPQVIGSHITFVFGPLSGGNHARQIIEKHGYHCAEEEKAAIAQAIKNYYADRRKGITDEELLIAYRHYRSPIYVEGIAYAKDQTHQASLNILGKFFEQQDLAITHEGDNSALAALAQAVERYYPGIIILDCRSNSCDGMAVNAKSHSVITIKTRCNKNYIGEAIDADIEIAALKALIDAVNQAYVDEHFRTKASEENKEVAYG
jgi:2-isopropylmalate synthase